MESWIEEVKEIERRRRIALQMGGEEKIAELHQQGKLTVRERLLALFDPGTFQEFGILGSRVSSADGADPAPDGYVMGVGKVYGRWACAGGNDTTMRGGGTRGGRATGAKQSLAIRIASQERMPLIWLIDGAGASVREVSVRGYMDLPRGHQWRYSSYSGQFPIISAIVGSAAGEPALRAPVADFVIMTKGSCLFAAGPPLVERSTGETVTKEELGGYKTHAYISGVVDNVAENDADCMRQTREYLSYFPGNCWQAPPRVEMGDDPRRREEGLLTIIPRNRRRAYDMKKLIGMIVDKGQFFEIKPYYGRSVITGLARLDGHPVGIIASNPMYMAGAIDGPSSDKEAHFIQLCDCYHVPMLFLQDVPGYMIGTKAEQEGVLRRGLRVAWAVSNCTVPSVCVVVRKSYGMGGVSLGGGPGYSLTVCWPSAEFGSLPIEGGVQAAFKRDIEAAADPAAKRAELEAELAKYRTPWVAAEQVGFEDIIDPRDTRATVIQFFELSRDRQLANLGPRRATGIMP